MFVHWNNLSFLAGIITVPSTLGGIVLGSSAIKFFKMNLKEILTMNLILITLSMPCIYAVYISCPNMKVAGVTTTYTSSKWR